jgi:hypothetical protein
MLSGFQEAIEGDGRNHDLADHDLLDVSSACAPAAKPITAATANRLANDIIVRRFIPTSLWSAR